MIELRNHMLVNKATVTDDKT